MAKSRLELQAMFEQLLGSRNVYFQPPKSIRLNYPAIIYSLSDIRKDNADNSVYMKYKEYEVMVIDRDPDSDIAERVSELDMCRFVRAYCADDLNHFVFTIFY